MSYLRIGRKKKVVMVEQNPSRVVSRSIYSLGNRLDQGSLSVLEASRQVARWRYQHGKK